jgi:N-acetylmuramoyl-L-alanine amidase
MFNESLAQKVNYHLSNHGIDCEIVYRNIYTLLPAKVNKTNADIAVSMHCNALNEKPNGTEVLYYKGSQEGAALAISLQRKFIRCLNLKDRGVNPRALIERGGYLLRSTKMPCVIAEPFFIDSDELLMAIEKNDELAEAYANGIMEYFVLKEFDDGAK